MTAHVDSVVPLNRATRLYGHKITKAWQASVESILEVGRLLIEAKSELPHGNFEVMVTKKCPFGKRTAQTLMQIANHPVIGKAQHSAHLPASWTTLYELSRFEPKELSHAIGNHWVKPEMSREDVKLLHARTQKALGTRKRMPPNRAVYRPKKFQNYLKSSIDAEAREWLASLDERVARTVADRVADLIKQIRMEVTDGQQPKSEAPGSHSSA